MGPIILRKVLLSFSIPMVLGCLPTFAQSFKGGEGTADNPFIIGDIDDLEALNEATNNNQTEGVYYLLANDITTPFQGMIGTIGVFHGIFDGNGHTIMLDINRSEDYVGLFGTTSRATLKNIQIDGRVAANHYVGGIAGNPSNGTVIENCINYAAVIGSTRVGGIAGGIVSVSSSAGGGVTVQNCTNCGVVSGIDVVGGFIGYSGQQIGNTLRNLVNYGHVDAPERSGDERLGGVIGNPLFDDVVSAVINLGTISTRTISGCMGSGNPESQSSLFYDSQMSPTYYSYPRQMRLTREIIGDGLKSEGEGDDMSEATWLYEEEMLLRPKMNGLELTERAILYATPIILDDESQIDNIMSDFRVGVKHGVKWQSKNGKITFTDSGEAHLKGSGDDVLIATLGEYSREINVSVTADLTRIGSIEADEDNGKWHTISGQPVNEPTTRGIYIRNGKKIIK